MPLVFPGPPISTSSAHLFAFLFASTYVGSLYVSKNARLSFSSKVASSRNGIPRLKANDERWRDDPDVIRARLAAVTIATLLCCVGICGVLWYLGGSKDNSISTMLVATFARLGLTPKLDIESIYPHLVTPILFLGPLYAQYLGGGLPLQKSRSLYEIVTPKILTWQGARNYVVAPITEEIVFRACVLAMYHLSGASRTRMIFLAPLSFGLAHIHHAWDTYNRYGRTASAAKRAIIMSIFQLAYTTLFGFHCSYLFLRTASVLPPISAHIFCNIMGLPQISLELQMFPKHKRSIAAAYILGVVWFIILLQPWTRTPGSMYWVTNDGY